MVVVSLLFWVCLIDVILWFVGLLGFDGLFDC